ncbi:BppU family phage baseplate upper protein, partial [Staphylococcus aureus]|nr:BppU family phage baseplate upper protein [Staphylococcus aureus]
MFEDNLRKTDNLINLETTSKYQALTDTNIQFYNMDIGTSELNFMVTKDNNPLLISDNNVDAHIGLVAHDGSKIVDDLEFIDP